MKYKCFELSSEEAEGSEMEISIFFVKFDHLHLDYIENARI